MELDKVDKISLACIFSLKSYHEFSKSFLICFDLQTQAAHSSKFYFISLFQTALFQPPQTAIKTHPSNKKLNKNKL